MKKLILSLLACGSIAAANAQAGSTLLYGNVGISNTSNADNSKAMSWNVSPGVGYQFDNHWTAGIYVDYRNVRTNDGTTGAKWMGTNNYELGLFARYTHNLNRIFSLYGQLNAGFTHGNETLDGSTVTNTRSNGFAIGFTPVIAANIHNGLALNFGIGGIGYTTSTMEHSSNSTNTFNFTFGHMMNIGISKNFGGHNHRIHREPGTDRHMKNYRDNDGDEPKKHKKSSDDNDE